MPTSASALSARSGVLNCSKVTMAGLLMAAAGAAAAAAPPGVRHVSVDAPAGGDGLSWATAYNDLRQALITAGSSGGTITELWVRQGNYLPAPVGSTDKTRNFTLVPGVGVYGGFVGDETQRDQRDASANITVLSGVLGTTRVNNVVIGAGNAQTVLDGFTISGGRASAPDISGTGWAGGGIYITGSPVIRDCIISGNAAASVVDSSVSLIRHGGGVYCAPGSAATLTACVITSNTMERSTARDRPAGRGAGLSAVSCTVNLLGCVISNNITGTGSWFICGGGQPIGGAHGGDGGGLHFTDAAVLIQDCRVVDNATGHSERSPACGTIIQCGTFGRPGGNGGGVYAVDSAVVMINTQLTGNVTGAGAPGASGYCATSGGNGGDGGGVYSAQSSVTLIGCLLGANRTGDGGVWAGSYGDANGGSGGDGAGVWASGGDVRLINCTITGGQLGLGQPGTPPDHGDPGTPAGLDGENGTGAAAIGAAVHLENCIAWNTLETSELVSATAGYSDVRGAVVYPGPGNINADPQFVSTSNFRLQPTSPCIDAGNSFPAGVTLPATDLDGLNRRVDIAAVADTGIGAPVVDMGAHEVQNSCAIDYTGDGLVDFADYLEFLNLYDAADPRADLTADGLVDFSDYLEFLNQYDAGC